MSNNCVPTTTKTARASKLNRDIRFHKISGIYKIQKNMNHKSIKLARQFTTGVLIVRCVQFISQMVCEMGKYVKNKTGGNKTQQESSKDKLKTFASALDTIISQIRDE